MKTILLILLFFPILSFSEEICDGLKVYIAKVDKKDATAITIRDNLCHVIKDSYFHTLSNAKIRVKRFKTKDELTNFNAQPSLGRLKGPDYGYTIHYDPIRTMLSERSLPQDIIKSILAHELAHVLDYQGRQVIGILAMGIGIMALPKVHSRIEHWADYVSFYAGYKSGQRYIDGAIAYENWIRSSGKSEEREHVGGGTKFPTYMSPKTLELIRAFVDNHLLSCPGEMDRFFQQLIKEVPLLDTDIEKFILDFGYSRCTT